MIVCMELSASSVPLFACRCARNGTAIDHDQALASERQRRLRPAGHAQASASAHVAMAKFEQLLATSGGTGHDAKTPHRRI